MSIYLLDASVVLPLALEDHELHQLVESWVKDVPAFALCPITEGALIRTAVRLGTPTSGVKTLLTQLYADRRCAFWPDALSYVDADLARVIGHKQVTDAYLVSLARSRDSTKLATLDIGLVINYPDVAELVTRSIQ